MILVASRTGRLGVVSLWTDGTRWAVHLKNRTQDTWVDIPAERVPAWIEKLTQPKPPA